MKPYKKSVGRMKVILKRRGGLEGRLEERQQGTLYDAKRRRTDRSRVSDVKEAFRLLSNDPIHSRLCFPRTRTRPEDPEPGGKAQQGTTLPASTTRRLDRTHLGIDQTKSRHTGWRYLGGYPTGEPASHKWPNQVMSKDTPVGHD